MTWFDYLALGSMLVAALVAIFTRRRDVAIGGLSVLVLFDVLDPVQALIWPN